MKLKYIALLLSFSLLYSTSTAIILAQTTPAQQKDEKEPSTSAKRFSVKLFEIKHRDPGSLANALYALGSGDKGATMQANPQLRTITVRDYPENIAAIEEALKRLDVPEQSPVSLETQLHLLSASMAGPEKSELPKNLESVAAQLKATLKFSNYRYISSALNRVSNGGKVESSGVTGSLFPTPAGVANNPDTPSFYNYSMSNVKLTQDATGKETIQIDNFKFGVSVPIRIVTSGSNLQYRDIGIITPLTLREGEMAVVGTANISGSDEAIIVIVSVKKVR